MKSIVGFYLFQVEGNITFLHRIMFILPCGKDYFGIFSEHIFFFQSPPLVIVIDW